MHPILYILMIVAIFVAFVLVVALLNSMILLSYGQRYAKKRWQQEVDALKTCLPGTNCKACGCESCAAFAESLETAAGLDQCPYLMEEQKAVAQQILEGRQEEMERTSRRAQDAREKDKKSIIRRWHAKRKGERTE